MKFGIHFDKLKLNKLAHDFPTIGDHLDSDALKRIERVNFPGNPRLKPFHMLGYLWELAHDLCLAPGSNISGNPGFETVLGIH